MPAKTLGAAAEQPSRACLLVLFLTAAAWAVWPPALRAQTGSGRVVGSVTDPTGAAIADAGITVTNEGTRIARTTSTDSAGNFAVLLLNPGTYSVRVEKSGFESQVTSGITVEVSQESRVDFRLALGAVSQAVEVTAEAPLLQTTNATVGHVVSNKPILDLPLNGRNFMELAVLSPAAVTPGGAAQLAASQGASFAGQSLPSIAGQRPASFTAYLDGFLNTRPWDQTPVIRPSIDALQEFKIQTSSTSAETVRNVAGIQIATRSGTNALHGSLFEFLRNDALDARAFFDRQISPLRQNQFGVVLGGPVVLPKVYNGRDRTFFLVNWESNRRRVGSIRSGNFPTQAMKAGNFSDVRDRNGNLIPIYDPDTTDPVTGRRLPFAGNIIPQNRLDPVASRMMQFYPEPNSAGFPNTVRALTSPTDDNQVNTRIDHQFGSNSLLARFGWQEDLRTDPSLVNLGGWNIDQHSLSTGLAWTRAFTPRFVNVARVGFLTSRTYQVQDAVKANRNLNTEVGIRNVEGFDRISYALPGLILEGGTFAGLGGPQSFKGIVNNWQFESGATYTTGTHTLTFGGMVYRSRTSWGSGGATGYYAFNGQYTAQLNPGFTLVPGTGQPFADFLLGQVRQSFLTNQGGLGDYFDTSYFLYFGDTWRATSRLAINWGLNWQFIGPFIEKYGRMSFPDFSAASYAMGGRQINTCRPIDAYHPVYNPGNHFGNILDPSLCIDDPGKGARHYDNFAPRFGLSYRVTDKMVLRLGGGLFYDFNQQASQMAGMTGDPPYPIFYSLTSAGPRRTDLPLQTLFPPFSQMASAGQTSGRVVGPKLEDRFRPYIEQWNISIERQFTPNILLELGYIGSAGHHLELLNDINQARPDPPGLRTPIDSRRPLPNFPGQLLQLHEMVGNSNYNGGYAKFERRFSDGVSLYAAYTWSAALGWGGTNFYYAQSGRGTPIQNPLCLRCEYSRLDEDVPHRLVLTSLVELPFGRGKRFLPGARGVTDHLVGGWQVNTLLTFQSGAPYSVFDPTDSANIGFNQARANYRAGQTSPPSMQDFRKTGFAFDPTFFDRKQPGQPHGNSGRNILRGGGVNNWDISLFKNFRLREATSLQFRSEFYNAFNHAQFTQPSNNVLVGNFGTFAPGSVRAGRIIQMALKLYF